MDLELIADSAAPAPAPSPAAAFEALRRQVAVMTDAVTGFSARQDRIDYGPDLAIHPRNFGTVNGHRSFRKSGRLKFPDLAGAVWVSVISRTRDRKSLSMVAVHVVSAVAAG